MSTNISKQKRDALLDKINQIKNYISAAPQDENTANLLTYIGELTKEINGKKYGLVFEEHREKIDELLEENAPVLVEQEDLFIDNGGEMNFLIEGDNLAALKLLEKTHKGKIDVIYIDPPYNTGNKDFIYDDDYVDEEDSFRHSKWISFMKQRLFLSKELLINKGLIFISIDDNEGFDLKVLCDEIFGNNNFIANVIWRKKYGGGKGSNYFVDLHEYILVYAKNKNLIQNFKLDRPKEKSEIFQLEDEYVKERGKYYIRPLKSGLALRKTLIYPIICPDGSEITTQWICGKDTYETMKKEGRIVFKQLKNGKYNVYKKFYEFDKDGKINPESIFYDLTYNQNGKEEIKKIFKVSEGREVPFSNAKPTDLIKYILNFIGNDYSTILDFFAGSGTTGHAVMKLNAEDGGNRKFILCTNNENNICQDVTYQRLKTVITGKRKDGSDYDENYKASLKYFKIDYLPIKDKMYYEYADELLEHVKELVELENAIDFNSNKSVAIVLDDDELDDFVENIADYPECKTLYMGHDVLTSYQQEQTIKAHGITINTVPDYYYRDLAN